MDCRPIDLQPIGALAMLEELQAFAAAYLSRPVRVREPIAMPAVRARGDQLLTTDILEQLKRRRHDAECVVAVTARDLYPAGNWDFVFGQAIPAERVAVFSVARYSDPDPRAVLRRACKVLAHETAHAFGIGHCVRAPCVMNPSRHLAESDARPLDLCAPDLRKLRSAVRFDVDQREKRLRDVIGKLQL